MKKPEASKLRQLFFSTLYLSAFTFGGGYVIVTLLKKKFVDELHWINEEEMLDLVAIAQSSPGAIAVNGAIVVGYKIAGLPGIAVSILGAIIPPFVIITAISSFYSVFRSNIYIRGLLRGMTAGVGAVIMSVVAEMMAGLLRQKDAALTVIMIMSFIANYYLRINTVWITLACAAFGLFRTLIQGHRQGKNVK